MLLRLSDSGPATCGMTDCKRAANQRRASWILEES
jgi:hypothetical protein